MKQEPAERALVQTKPDLVLVGMLADLTYRSKRNAAFTPAGARRRLYSAARAARREERSRRWPARVGTVGKPQAKSRRCPTEWRRTSPRPPHPESWCTHAQSLPPRPSFLRPARIRRCGPSAIAPQ